MKILHVINSFEGGGAEKIVLYLHENYLNIGIDSHALSFVKSNINNVPNAHCLGLDTPYQFSILSKLYNFLSQPMWRDLDIIHVHLFPAQLYLPIFSKLFCKKAKLVFTEHTSFNDRRNTVLGKIIDIFSYGFYSKVICVSSFTLQTLGNWLPQFSHKLLVINNGIDFEKYSYLPANRKEKASPVIISVGRLTEQKNYETMIKSVAKINNLNFEYWILGMGSLEVKLKNLVEELNLENKVKFLGFRQNIPEILSQADIFMQVSLYEGLSLAMIEAMAAGLPILVSDIPEITDIVSQDSQVGFVVNSKDEEEIANYLTLFLKDSSLRLSMGENAYKLASNFDMEKVVNNHINLYKNII